MARVISDSSDWSCQRTSQGRHLRHIHRRCSVSLTPFSMHHVRFIQAGSHSSPHITAAHTSGQAPALLSVGLLIARLTLVEQSYIIPTQVNSRTSPYAYKPPPGPTPGRPLQIIGYRGQRDLLRPRRPFFPLLGA